MAPWQSFVIIFTVLAGSSYSVFFVRASEHWCVFTLGNTKLLTAAQLDLLALFSTTAELYLHSKHMMPITWTHNCRIFMFYHMAWKPSINIIQLQGSKSVFEGTCLRATLSAGVQARQLNPALLCLIKFTRRHYKCRKIDCHNLVYLQLSINESISCTLREVNPPEILFHAMFMKVFRIRCVVVSLKMGVKA